MKIEFPKPASVKWINGQRYLDGNAKCIVHVPDIGAVHGVKCTEFYQQKGQPVPEGTPTVAEALEAWEKQKEAP